MNIESILVLFGGANLVLIGLSGWLGKRWLDRALEKEKHTHQAELERLKSEHQLGVSSQIELLRAEFSKQQAILAGSVAAASSAGALGQKEKLRAIERMWIAAKCQRNTAAPAVTYWDLIHAFNPDALTPKGRSGMAEMLDPSKLMQRCEKEDDEAENLRPFLGEELWGLYYSYRMLIGRASIPLGLSLQRNEKPEVLYEDEDVARLIEQILTEEEFSKFNAMKRERLRWLLSRLEDRMMATAAAVISGQRAALDSYAHSSEILATARKLESTISEKEHHARSGTRK